MASFKQAWEVSIEYIIQYQIYTIAYPWCDGHFTSISACGMWEVRAGVQVFRRELHTNIHLDQVRVEFLSYIKIKIKIDLSKYILNKKILISKSYLKCNLNPTLYITGFPNLLSIDMDSTYYKVYQRLFLQIWQNPQSTLQDGF